MVTEIARLQDWIYNYFPDPTYSRDDVENYCKKHVRGWDDIPRKMKREILEDWETFTEEQLEGIELGDLPAMKKRGGTLWDRIKRFVKRLF